MHVRVRVCGVQNRARQPSWQLPAYSSVNFSLNRDFDNFVNTYLCRYMDICMFDYLNIRLQTTQICMRILLNTWKYIYFILEDNWFRYA